MHRGSRRLTRNSPSAVGGYVSLLGITVWETSLTSSLTARHHLCVLFPRPTDWWHYIIASLADRTTHSSCVCTCILGCAQVERLICLRHSGGLGKSKKVPGCGHVDVKVALDVAVSTGVFFGVGPPRCLVRVVFSMHAPLSKLPFESK